MTRRSSAEVNALKAAQSEMESKKKSRYDVAGIEDRTFQKAQAKKRNTGIVISSNLAALPRKPNCWPPTNADKGGKSLMIFRLTNSIIIIQPAMTTEGGTKRKKRKSSRRLSTTRGKLMVSLPRHLQFGIFSSQNRRTRTQCALIQLRKNNWTFQWWRTSHWFRQWLGLCPKRRRRKRSRAKLRLARKRRTWYRNKAETKWQERKEESSHRHQIHHSGWNVAPLPVAAVRSQTPSPSRKPRCQRIQMWATKRKAVNPGCQVCVYLYVNHRPLSLVVSDHLEDKESY